VLFQSSSLALVPLSSAWKKSVPFTFVRCIGSESAPRAAMFSTMLVVVLS
jgi:hypothetical protein